MTNKAIIFFSKYKYESCNEKERKKTSVKLFTWYAKLKDNDEIRIIIFNTNCS
jgi:hypothetical protein